MLCDLLARTIAKYKLCYRANKEVSRLQHGARTHLVVYKSDPTTYT